MKFDLEKAKLLLLLVLTDLIFVILHILNTYTDVLPGSLFSLSTDRGFAEFFQYLKELWIAVLFLLLGMKRRQPLYLVFSSLFLYFLVDDSLEFHERLGALVSDWLEAQPALGLRAVDFGELAVSIFFGVLFFAAIGIFHFLSDPATRRISIYIILMTGILAFFGILVDMVEIIIVHPGVNPILKILEEAGEMWVMSFLTWFTFRLDLSRDPIARISFE